MAHTLLVLRHAKSDWAVPVSDRERPLAKRGVRQAPHTGRWIADNDLVPDVVIVSPATRAIRTWELVCGAWTAPPTEVRIDEAAYTVGAGGLLGLVRATPESVARLALVGHNPAVEDLVAVLTDESVRMPTSALAVVDLDRWQGAGMRDGRLRYAGRPADESGF
ncbi:SixA phosphatase family protein [Nostocoides australiense]